MAQSFMDIVKQGIEQLSASRDLHNTNREMYQRQTDDATRAIEEHDDKLAALRNVLDVWATYSKE